MTSLEEMGDYELKIHAGNTAAEIWKRMPEPKLDYPRWYYLSRNQSLSEALEGYRVEVHKEDGNDIQI